MSKSVALANCLHRGELRVQTLSAAWHSEPIVLFSHGLGTIQSSDGDSTALGDDTGKVEWLELFRVNEIESIRPLAADGHEFHLGWRFAVVTRPRGRGRRRRSRSKSGDSDGGDGQAEFHFEASVESERTEWIRALKLAKQLRNPTPGLRDSGSSDAFFRFASSDSDDDYESDSASDSESVDDPFKRLNHGSTSHSPRAQAEIVAVMEVTVVDPKKNRISIKLSLSDALCQDAPLHQIKLLALDEMRKNVLESVSHNTTGYDFSWLQEFLRHEADFFVLLATNNDSSELWLKDEHHPLARVVSIQRPPHTIAVRLEPVSAMPFPKIQLSISTTKNRISDLSQRTYTAYLLDVAFNDMKWQVQRRFKEFHALNQELKQKYPTATLPKLPSKHVFTPLEGQFIARRRAQLEKYVLQLLEHPQISLDVLLLSFLGVVSTSRDRDLSKNEKSVIHVTALHVGLDFGDIILFSCRFGASVIQRKVTGSKYDHIGIVVPGASRNLLRILEATGEGIQVYSLKARLMAYSREVSNSIVVRRINVKRTTEAMKKMIDFVARVEGNPYSILGILQTRGESERLDLTAAASPTESGKTPLAGPRISFTRRSSQTASTASSDGRRPSTPTRRRSTGALVGSPAKSADESPQDSPKRKYFCSSLAAAALKHLGWLETTHKSSYFWPGSFEEGGEIEKYLAPGVSISKETVVDCRIIEVGLATTSDV